MVIIILLVSAFACTIQTSEAGTLEVGPGKTYSTIQSAVDAAGPGDTVLVYPGTYNEKVTIYKQLNVTSVGGASQTFITAAGLGVVPGNSFPLVMIDATGNVLFQGFTIQNAWNLANDREGIFTQCLSATPTYTILNNVIYGTNNASDDQDYGFYAQSGQENIVFRNNTITQTGANNILLEEHTGKIEISYNTFDAGVYGSDAIFAMAYDGVNVNTLQNVSYNTFNMGTGGPFDYDHRATAVSFDTPGAAWGLTDANFTNVVIQGNTINNLKSYRRGIGFWNGGGGGGGTIAPIVENNIITGITGSAGSFGIDFIGTKAGQNATVAYNRISDADVGVYLRTADSALGIKINYNSIIGNNVGLNNTIGAPGVDARFNYWGDSSGPSGTGPGTGQPILGTAVFDPWLSSYQVPAWTQVGTNPAVVEKHAFPGIEGVTFSVTIAVQNVTDLYGFEFNLTWDNSLIHLVGVEYAPELNQMWGSSWTKIQNITQNGSYDLVAVALAPAKGYNGYATLANLTFSVAYGPCYIATNYTLQTRLHFSTVKLSNSNAQPISAIVNDGQYLIYAVQPFLKISPATIICRKLNQTTTIQIKITDAYKVFGIDLQIKYNTTLLKINSIQWNDLSGFLPGPYLIQTYTVDSVNGLIRFTVVENLTAGAPLGYGDRPLVNVTFMAIKAMIWKNATGWTNYLEDYVSFTDWNITVSSPDTHSLTGNLVLISNADYRYVPIQGDVDSNGLVDIFDLSNVAKYYGIKNTDPQYVADYDLNNDGIIDVYDLIYIATNFGYRYDP